MKYSSSIKLSSNERDKKAMLDKISHGWESRVSLPFFHTLPFQGDSNGEYIALKGLNDYILIQKDEPRTLKTSIYIVNPGIVVEKGTVNGEQLRLPWECMVKSEVKGRKIYLSLDKNQTMVFTGFPYLRKEKFVLDFISKLINDNINES